MSDDRHRQVPASVLRLDPVVQVTDSSCGTAALATVARWWGVDVSSEADLWPLLRPGPAGARPTDLVRAARALGLRPKVVEGTSLDVMRLALATGVPPILDVQLWDSAVVGPGSWRDRCEDGHFVVLGGVSDGTAWLVDPSKGRWAWSSTDDLLLAWHDRPWPGEPCVRRVAVLVSGDARRPGASGPRVASPYP